LALALFGYHSPLSRMAWALRDRGEYLKPEEIALPTNAVREFLRLESSAGIVLISAAIVAELWANSPFGPEYFEVINTKVAVIIGEFSIDKPLLLWVNDGLMAVFFFLVGLEIKRELLEGELSRKEQVVLPCAAALGGFVLPALVYAWFNQDDPAALAGWAIPAATDIAFALGILSLLGDRVPVALKVFLTSLAIFDDMGAIVVISIFYTSNLSLLSLGLAALGIVVLTILSRKRVGRVSAYVVVGVFIWICVLKSGVHATLAGLIVAFFIPMRHQDEAYEGSPLIHTEHALHPWVAFLVLPVFAFANSGVELTGVGLDTLSESVPVGIGLGLLLGKPIGVLAASWIVVKLAGAELPAGATWGSMVGVAVLTGIGFTMSLLIGTLAFPEGDQSSQVAMRVGVLGGSTIAAVLGYLILARTLPRVDSTGPRDSTPETSPEAD
jgi:NhaA family Na+:H+ antiporter